ncbi:MAG: hypothetical protein PHN92_02160 [Geobacter sp.]|nr:hypothetical protein [Geobacter sp.]
MPLQNRVMPDGKIIATAARGTLMGNRGILHNRDQQLVKLFSHKSWVSCQLDFKGRKRKLMQPGNYTELFFLDEATALSAGHRPCGECQRERFSEFKSIWIDANGSRCGMSNPTIAQIDAVLHAERIDRSRSKVTYLQKRSELPNGAFFFHDGSCWLVWQEQCLKWSEKGYTEVTAMPPDQPLSVLTPRSIVECYRHGFVPRVHSSANQL